MLEKIIEMIKEQLNIDTDITQETTFKDDLGADSLDLFELITNIEDEYDIEIPSEDLENMTKVGEVVEYLKGKGIE